MPTRHVDLDRLSGASLQEYVKKKLRRRVTDEIWMLDRVQKAIERFEVQRDEATLQDIVDEVRFVLGRYRELAGLRTTARGASASSFRTSKLNLQESMRANAFSEALALQSLGSSEVQWVRRSILRGKWLLPAEADRLLTSPIVRLVHWFDAINFGRDFWDLDSSLSTTLDSKGTWRAQVDIPTINETRALTGSILPGSKSGAIYAEGEIYGHQLATVRHSDGRVYNVGYWRGSTLDELRARALSLGNRLGWEEPTAIWFLVTGVAPLMHPLQARISGNRSGRIEISMSPSISDETLLAFVRQLRLVAMGRKPPRASSKNLEVFTLVERETIVMGGVRQKWAFLMDKWNAAVSKAHRYSSSSTFARDYRRAERVIVRDLISAELRGLGRFEQRADDGN